MVIKKNKQENLIRDKQFYQYCLLSAINSKLHFLINRILSIPGGTPIDIRNYNELYITLEGLYLNYNIYSSYKELYEFSMSENPLKRLYYYQIIRNKYDRGEYNETSQELKIQAEFLPDVAVRKIYRDFIEQLKQYLYIVFDRLYTNFNIKYYGQYLKLLNNKEQNKQDN
jgi:hypothetical protein